MSDSSRPQEIRGRSFGQALRGYDRDEVDRFRDEMASEIESLLERLGQLESSAGALGIDDAESLRAELATVGEDVAEVLAVAQKAAEGLRSRAGADAAAWRAEADKESRAARTSARKDAEKARADAWDTATELLVNAQQTAADMHDRAAEDALFIRAEAEREALRLTGDARRDQEEIARSARTDADRLVQDAHVEAEQILEAARHSADSAQERARALERRRSELMEELEAARLSIGQLEHEIDTRREALASAADRPESGVRVVASDTFEWVDDGSGVRVVPGHVVPVDEPVDADSLVAEVEALQRAIDSTVADEEQPDPGSSGDEPDADSDRDELDVAPIDGAVESSPRDPTTGSDDVEAGAELEPLGDAAVAEEPDLPPEPPEAASEPEGKPIDVVGESAETDDAAVVEDGVGATEDAGAELSESSDRDRALDGLFARLRSPEPVVSDAQPASDTIETAPDVPSAVVAAGQDGVTDVGGSDSSEPSIETNEEARAATTVDPFDLRDRMLLPIENRALRSVKRRIVDLQNRVLEELRVGGVEWVPDRALLAATVGDEVVTLVAESHVAGHTAAADLTGSASTPRPERGPISDDGRTFVDEMASAVSEALSRARAAGGGSRQVSAAVSRVFRAWRTDEAERRLRWSARRAYHEGVIAGLESLGASRVMAVADGQPCGRCPAGTGVTWRPGHSLPAGALLPPATPGCTATVVPAE
jgi:DivIVA domain-containing protein